MNASAISRFSDLLLLSAPHVGAQAHFRLSLLALFSLAFSKIHPYVNEPKQVPCFTQGHRPFTPPSFLTVLHIRKTNNSRHLIFLRRLERPR